MKRKAWLTLFGLMSGLVASFSTSAAEVDPGLQSYERVSGISGNLSSVGSDTLANLMTLWTESFKQAYPNVNIQVQAAGSSTAPPALTEGTSNFGPMSRMMKDKEIEAFERRFGRSVVVQPRPEFETFGQSAALSEQNFNVAAHCRAVEGGHDGGAQAGSVFACVGGVVVLTAEFRRVDGGKSRGIRLEQREAFADFIDQQRESGEFKMDAFRFNDHVIIGSHFAHRGVEVQ